MSLFDKIPRLFQKKRKNILRSKYLHREYQFEFVTFPISKTDKVLDLGSGNHPFALATHLSDLYIDDHSHRGGSSIARDDRPFSVVDIESLPFKDKEFDFVYCSHVLEHVKNPGIACRELMRVGARGYIETPTRTSDIMYNYTYLHSWHISIIGSTFIFIPYSEREKKGTGSKEFESQMRSPYQNHFNSLVYKNRDLFCNMLVWENKFDFIVFDVEGNIIDSSK